MILLKKDVKCNMMGDVKNAIGQQIIQLKEVGDW